MLGGVGKVGTLGAKRRVVSASGGGASGQFLKSQGLTGAQGFTLNTAIVSKDMSASTNSGQIPAGYNPRPNFVLTPNNSSLLNARRRWGDWGSDIFDNWGDFYIYNPADQTADYIALGDINASPTRLNGGDGTFYTETLAHHGKSFKVVHGWATQGIFKLDIACTSDETFQFAIGHYGNMGSDSNTANFDRTHSASWGTLHYNHNNQTRNATDIQEFFYCHVIPKKKADNDTFSIDSTGLFTAVSGNDNLAIWTGAFTHGFTCYYVKGSNNSTGSMANWVANDIAISNTYYD